MNPEEPLGESHSALPPLVPRGKLRIYLGYAAGVGKTYAMLDAAHQRKNEGVKVVIGAIKTSGWDETIALLEGLEVVPPRMITLGSTTLPEMDVDAVLACQPALVLVDELAHANPSGSRHPKRWQDVEEFLAAGIDVYTTVNIQQLESLKDTVPSITGHPVHETIPDRLLDEADEIELIDIPPDELLKRLQEPIEEGSQTSGGLRAGNLNALRELAMRRAAGRLDDQMDDLMQGQKMEGGWKAGERLLVCISTHPRGERLVRAGYRLANELNATWHVIFVETPGEAHLATPRHTQVARTMQLAESLGAKTATLVGHSSVQAILEYAYRNNITKIIVGKPIRPGWQTLLQGSLIDQLIQNSGSIDVYIISDGETLPLTAVASSWTPHRPLLRYLKAATIAGLITVLGILFQNFLHPTNLIIVFLTGVVFTAILWGRGPSLLASVISVLVFDFFFIDPKLSFSVSDTQYLITIVGFWGISLLISNLTGQVREQVKAAQQRQAQTEALNALSRDLTIAVSMDDMLKAVIEHIHQAFSREVAVWTPENGQLKLCAATPDFIPDEKEQPVTRWAFEHAQTAGRGTDTHPEAIIRYIPLITTHGVAGVLGVRPTDPHSFLTPNQRHLLEGFASLTALAIERMQLTEQANQAKVLSATERLQTSLLNSISHDLRTPLVSIQGVLDSLSEEEKGNTPVHLDQETRIDMIENAREETRRLNRLVENLLEMTRLEAGTLRLSCDLGDVQDVIGSALGHLDEYLRQRPVSVRVPNNIPMVPMDFVLIEQVLINLLDNALKYSPPGSPIEVEATLVGREVQISVADAGIGIPPEDLERIFDKFYRVKRSSGVKGSGLGLSICKGIIEAHNGRIWAAVRPTGGSRMTLALPLPKDENC